jgi:hypothetical protein
MNAQARLSRLRAFVRAFTRANIGATSRHVVDAETGERRHFVSGYANAHLPKSVERDARLMLLRIIGG